MRKLRCLRRFFLSILIASVAIGYSPFSSARSSRDLASGYTGLRQAGSMLSASESPHAYVVEAKNERSECRPATAEEAASITGPIEDSTLHVITPVRRGLRPEAVGGLQITLRGTSQLDQFPDAKAAFLRAAANWQAVIATPISIVIDVDFGPNFFGKPFAGKDILGVTDPQDVSASNVYSLVRASLIANASSATDLALYNALPSGNIPTDLGPTTRVAGPTAVFRSLGLLVSVADPSGEQTQLGSPPRVAFNSNAMFPFTFDPSGGIAPNTIDFDAVATHEVGHVLGFHSSVGETQLMMDPLPLSASVFDMFRFRPGTTMDTFGSANRIETTGGNQDFFFGVPELPLSTGGPDGKGGDGNQASHWKSEDVTGTPIGIMIPAIAPGERRTITANDLKAFESMGYSGQAVTAPGTIALTSGVAQTGSVSMPQAGSCVLGTVEYSIPVPMGATQLTVDITGDQSSTDLFVRYGRPVIIVGGQPVTDYSTPTTKATQEIIASGSTSPPLAAGTYFIGVGNCAAAPLNFTLTATVSGGSTGGDPPPTITALSANLQGNTLTLTGTATDPDGDITQADITLLDGAGHAVGDTGLFSGSFGTSTTSSFALSVTNMQNFLSALKASLVLADSKGQKSAASVADFSEADPGGPQITSASFDAGAGLLSVRGSGFAQPIQLESNGQMPNVRIKIKGGGSKLKIAGSAADLDLVSGANRIRIFVGTLRSNIFIATN